MSFHTIIIVGNLGRDPEMRYTPNGNAVTSLNVASNRVYTDTNGQKVKETTWFRVSVWGKQAENANNYLQKGSMVLIEGELRPDRETGNPRTFTRNDGTTGASYEVFARNLRFLSSTRSGGGGAESVDEGPEMNDEDIPF
ncbi:MAG: single-stranded DNA-binding protein [Anaerolineae bacterium]|jgi:single-strand DNA-binding protein|nr:single-stranded DNA-binding protein [Anaerolineae bacterium]